VPLLRYWPSMWGMRNAVDNTENFITPTLVLRLWLCDFGFDFGFAALALRLGL